MELQNHFLIASPQMEDDYFSRSLIFICEHNEQGSMGLVINQPTDLSVAELSAKLNFMMSSHRQINNQMVLAGGPVNAERGFILHTPNPQAFKHSYKISDRLTLTTSIDVVESFGGWNEPDKYLVSLGCASWSAGQLEQEIRRHDWFIAPSDESILFDVPYEQRWEKAYHLLGIEQHNLSLASSYKQ